MILNHYPSTQFPVTLDCPCLSFSWVTYDREVLSCVPLQSPSSALGVGKQERPSIAPLAPARMRHILKPCAFGRAASCQEWGLEAITYLDKDNTMAKIFGRGFEPRDQ
jgi:hypothetical protein